MLPADAFQNHILLPDTCSRVFTPKCTPLPPVAVTRCHELSLASVKSVLMIATLVSVVYVCARELVRVRNDDNHYTAYCRGDRYDQYPTQTEGTNVIVTLT